MVTGDAVYVRNVESEGVRIGTFLDAKYARSSGSFYEWHFADDAVARAVRRLFIQNRVPITVRYTPSVGAP